MNSAMVRPIRCGICMVRSASDGQLAAREIGRRFLIGLGTPLDWTHTTRVLIGCG